MSLRDFMNHVWAPSDPFGALASGHARPLAPGHARRRLEPKPTRPLVLGLGVAVLAFSTGTIRVGSTANASRNASVHVAEPSPQHLSMSDENLSERIAAALALVDARFGGAESMIDAAVANVERSRADAKFELPEELYFDELDELA